MIRTRWAVPALLAMGAAAGCAWILEAQDQLPVADPVCTYFGPQRDHFLPRNAASRGRLSQLTAQVTAALGNAAPRHAPAAHGAIRTEAVGSGGNLIDGFIWQAFKENGVTPAAPTNDYEFIRRVTLDLTGRIPTADAVETFVADPSPNKRAVLIDNLLASPEWLDRWTMFFGDLFKNASTFPSTGTRIYPAGRDGFNTWIRNALSTGMPYNRMAAELIGSQGTDNFTQGELNWMPGGRVTGGPVQDIWDQQTANVADTFLGISHMNCLLCHNGRGHLDSLSLWGSNFTRQQAWGFSAFLSHTALANPPVDPSNPKGVRMWYVRDNAYKTDYKLNTTTGNRPPRQPFGTSSSVAPQYPFGQAGPNAGEGYRQAMARLVTGDFQFARAAVNYLWDAFFGMGLVDPPDQFDPARLDPDNPPPAPWTLQPSNPGLLNALAQDFIASNYDVKHVMRLIANSNTYQLESQYDPAKWNPDWQPLFARKLVRRLWGEELADSIALSSGIPNSFKVALGTGNATIQWAMQYPEPSIESKSFLQSFLPGDRDLNPRRGDGSIQQALALMNDPLVMSKLNAAGGGATQSLLGRALAQTSDDALTQLLYINILSRQATSAELQTAEALLSSGARAQKAQELMWTLYNKVDFIFNY